jgi:hypothetical protein
MGKFEEQAAQAPPLERKEETGGYFILANKDLVNAMLSRLRHRCHAIRIKGLSLREPQS